MPKVKKEFINNAKQYTSELPLTIFSLNEVSNHPNSFRSIKVKMNKKAYTNFQISEKFYKKISRII